MPQLGRHVLGLGAIAYGGAQLAFHTSPAWLLVIAAVELLGGLALLGPGVESTAVRGGAWALSAVYAVATALMIRPIVAHPLAFSGWGNMGEQLPRLCGAVLVLTVAMPGRTWTQAAARVAYWLFALCVVTFGVYQITGYGVTLALVPKWLPPSQAFWANATTVAFLAAAAALLVGWMARLASRLLTAMLAGFAVLVWVPILYAHPRGLGNWGEFATTVSIAGAAWVVAEYLTGYTSRRSSKSTTAA